MEELVSKLHRIDGRGYKAYKELTGNYRFPDSELCVLEPFWGRVLFERLPTRFIFLLWFYF